MSLVPATPVDPVDGSSPELIRIPGPGAVSAILAGLLATVVRPVIALFARFPDARWPFARVDRAAALLPRPRRTTRRRVAPARAAVSEIGAFLRAMPVPANMSP